MTGKNEFRISGQPVNDSPFHYTACGLEDVYLLNGFRVEKTPYGEGVAVDDIDELHRAIGLHLIAHRKALSPKEFRFLRKQLDMTQAELGRALGVSSQTVARYEKGETEIAGPADSMLRVLYVFSLLPEEMRLQVVEQVIALAKEDRDEIEPGPVLFRTTEQGWAEAA